MVKKKYTLLSNPVPFHRFRNERGSLQVILIAEKKIEQKKQLKMTILAI
jgi:hypothetical protein